MMEIVCRIEHGEEPGDYDYDGYPTTVPTTEAKCTRCGHTTWCYGDGDDSITRCLATIREECGQAVVAWYVAKATPLTVVGEVLTGEEPCAVCKKPAGRTFRGPRRRIICTRCLAGRLHQLRMKRKQTKMAGVRT